MIEATISLTPDEVANVQSALEAHIEYLASDYGERDHEGDASEVLESTKNALSKVNHAAFVAFVQTERQR